MHLYTVIKTLARYLKHSTFEYCLFFLTCVFIYRFNPHIIISRLLTRARIQFQHECVLHLLAMPMRFSYRSRFYPSFYICQDIVTQEKKISVFLSSRMKAQDIQFRNRDVHTSNGHTVYWWRDFGLSVVFSGYFSVALNGHVIRR